MAKNLIAIDEQDGSFAELLERVMRLVPERDNRDPDLRRLLAFRLRIDGEDRLREFLVKKIRAAIDCGYAGSFFEFVKDDLKAHECRPKE